jgi:uncharacterized protein with HEPN domain
MTFRENIKIANEVAQGKAELTSMLISIKQSFDKIQEFCADTQKNQFEMNEKIKAISLQLAKMESMEK